MVLIRLSWVILDKKITQVCYSKRRIVRWFQIRKVFDSVHALTRRKTPDWCADLIVVGSRITGANGYA